MQVGRCYDHLGGVLGERLTQRLLDLGWVTPDPAPGVTPIGWAGLQELGLNLGPLTASRRKPVAFCLERHDGQRYAHIGAHLGTLLQHHFLKSGWLESSGDHYELTPAGQEVLRRLGVSMEDRT